MQSLNIKNNKTLLLLTLVLLLVASGCTMAPTYERPDAPVPSAFPDYQIYSKENVDGAVNADGDKEKTDGASAWNSSTVSPLEGSKGEGAEAVDATQKAINDEFPAPMNIAWNDFFDDPNLQKLISLSLTENRNLRVAMLNVEAARASYRVQTADLFPTIAATGANSNQLMPANMSTRGEKYISRQSSATVGITSFELDLFGRVRSLKAAALESYFKEAQNAHAARLTLVSEVANAYLQLVANKELHALADETYASRQESFELTEKQYNLGVASKIAYYQAKTLRDQAVISQLAYITSELQSRNALVLLLGAPIPTDMVIPSNLSEVKALRELPVGLPSQLLERRPDILAAEHALKSANANIGAARASFFPTIGLTANLGFMSTDLDKLFGGDHKTWSFVPGVSLPIFEGGRLMANLKGANVSRETAVANYEQTIQTAFSEVSDALAQRSTVNGQVEAYSSLVEASKETLDMANLRYEVGVDSYMEVLDAQRTYFSARQSQISTLLLREVNCLQLYKVLGGGWQ